MDDEQDYGYQTESEPIETEVTESEPVETETVDSPPQEEPKGIKVKYNKEEQFVPETDIPSYVQKGLNYDKVQQQLEQTKQQAAYLDRLAKMSGYDDTPTFLKAVEEAEQQRQIQEEAQRYQLDPETYTKLVQPIKQENQQTKQQLEQMQNDLFSFQIEREVNRLKSQFPDFEQHQDEVFKLAQDLNLPPNRLDYAYKLATYDKIGQQKEQQVLAQVTGRTGKQIVPSADKPSNNKFNPGDMSLKDIDEMSKRVQRGETIRF